MNIQADTAYTVANSLCKKTKPLQQQQKDHHSHTQRTVTEKGGWRRQHERPVTWQSLVSGPRTYWPTACSAVCGPRWENNVREGGRGRAGQGGGGRRREEEEEEERGGEGVSDRSERRSIHTPCTNQSTPATWQRGLLPYIHSLPRPRAARAPHQHQ